MSLSLYFFILSTLVMVVVTAVVYAGLCLYFLKKFKCVILKQNDSDLYGMQGMHFENMNNP